MKIENNRILLYFCCLILYFFNFDSSLSLITILLGIILCNILQLIKNPSIKIGLLFIYIGLSFFLPHMLLFAPILMYELPINLTLFYPLLFVVPLIYHGDVFRMELVIFLCLFYYIAHNLKTSRIRFEKYQKGIHVMQDNANELSILLKEKNQALLENQDYERNVATLNERNRISKELHDSIGHLISRSLLMIGALLTISKEEPVNEGLSLLKESLSDGMTNIRNSIHNIHDESIDLYTSLETIVKEFTYCPIQFEYDIKTNLNSKIKYSILAIIKEGLSNIMKHSNCNHILLVLREHPAMYQIILSDNGTIDERTQSKLNKMIHGQHSYEGMGLQNILDRTKSFQGIANITFEQGLRIFITIPKDIQEL